MKIKSTISTALKKKLFHTTIYNEEWLAQLAEREKLLPVQNPHIYGTNIENVMPSPAAQTYMKELAIEHILDSVKYTFQDSLLLLNPYKMSVLTALLIFNTTDKYKVRYTIKGLRGSKDYTVCDEIYTTKHRVPIIGLYDNAYNMVEVCLIDINGQIKDTNKLMIHTPKLAGKMRTPVTITKHTEDIGSEFILVTGGYSGSTYGFDQKGNIRFMLSRPPHPYGIHQLKNGHFLYAEKNMRRPNYGNAHSAVMHEMDYMGRVYKTILNPNGFHHWATSESNTGNYLIASSSIKDSYGENMILEIDHNTGNILRSINVNNLFDNTYITRHDWAHINAFEYIEEDDAVIVSMRNIHTIAKISLRDNKICWIIANPKFYAKTKQRDNVLKPDGHIDWFFQQHAVQVLGHDNIKHTFKIILFDNHTANRRPVKYFDKKEASNILILNIDEIKGTVSQEKRIETSLSITRSNAVLGSDKSRIFAMCGNLKPEIDGYRSKIYEYDYKTGKCVNEISCVKDFFCGNNLKFDVNELSSPIVNKEPFITGTLYEPFRRDKLPDKLKTAPDISEYVPDDAQDNETHSNDVFSLNMRIVGNLLQIYCQDHSIEKIYLYNKSSKYEQNFTDTEQTSDIFINQRYYISVPLDKIENGKYHIALKFHSNYYKTNYWIEKSTNKK